MAPLTAAGAVPVDEGDGVVSGAGIAGAGVDAGAGMGAGEGVVLVVAASFEHAAKKMAPAKGTRVMKHRRLFIEGSHGA